MADQQNLKLQDREYRLYKEIQVKFREVVDPLPLSDYLANCLTEDDLDIIKTTLTNSGRSKAAGELLDRLRRRPNWVYNLLLACSHPELGLEPLYNNIKDEMTKLEIRITIQCNDGHNCARISNSINDASEEALTQQGRDTQSLIEQILTDFKSRVDPEEFVQYLTRLKEEDETAVKCKQQQSGRLAAAEELVSRLLRNYTQWKDDLREALKCRGSGLEDLGEKLSETEIDEWDLQTTIKSLMAISDISAEEFTKQGKELMLEFVREQAKSLDEIPRVLQLAEHTDSPKMALQEVQKGYLFMLEHIHEEAQLVGYLCLLCESPLSDDEKIDMRDGKGYFTKKELLKCLISKGENACREFLEKFKCCQNLYSQFQNAVRSVTNADDIQQDVFLTLDKLPHYKALLLEEMEPTAVADILYCHAVLSSDEHDEIDEMSNRRDKATKLFTKIGQQPGKITVFCHALEQSGAVEYIRNSTSNSPLYSSGINAVKCVRFNFRKNLKYFKDCVSKKKLLDYLEINRCMVTSTGELVPKESCLIKTGLRNGKPWCDCILEFIKQTDFVFLKKLVGRLEKRRKDGREGVNLQFDVKMMKDMEDFLLHELEPAPISHVLLEEEAFSVDDHDEVENAIGRRKKAEALCGILLRDGSELTMESFLYALRKYQCTMNEIRRRGTGQQPITQQRPTDQSDIQIRHIGRPPENVEEIQAASGLELVLSIPVQVVGDVEGLQQAIDQLNIDPDFQAEVAMASHMTVRSISLGSVVLRLIALTDDACKMLFDENGKKMKTLIETFLHFSNIKEDMIKENIKVTVSVPEEETGNKLPTDDEIKIRGIWNLLVEELEPSTMAKKLFEKRVFNDDDTKKISIMKTRKEKVETLLTLLLSKKREVMNAFDAFIRSLDELGKGDIAVKIKPSEKMHQEAEKVRLGLLSKFKEAIDEIESSHMEETFELCGIKKHSVDFISSESGKSRKDRVLQFLIYVLLNDAYVLGLEKVLNNRGLTWLLEYPKDRNFTDNLMGAKCKRPPGEVLYQCQYEVERKEMKRLGRLRPPKSFTHKMISSNLKNPFESVKLALCVPEDTEHLSFAANLLKALHSEEIASAIKLLSYRLDFIDCFKDFRDEDPVTICSFDVDIVFNKDHLEVVKRDPFQWNNTSLLESERILKVILVHSRSLRVVETKLRVYKEYEMLFRSKTLHLQHEYEDFDEIAKKSANAKVSSFQRAILYLAESFSSEKLALIVSKAAEHSLLQSNVREICCNEFITDGENVGTVQSKSYTCRSFLTVRRIKQTLVINTLRTICKSLGFEIWKEIKIKIKTMYMNICEDQRQLNIEFPDTLIETITVEMMSFLISICDPIFRVIFAAGSFIGTFVFSVDVNSLIWREKVADEIYLMISKHQEDIVKKALFLVKNICEKTTEDLKNVDRSLEKWKEQNECMDIIELVSLWEKREAMKNISGLGSHKSVLNLIAGIKNDKPTLKVFLSIDDQHAIRFIENHPEIPKGTVFEFVVLKSNKEQKDPAKIKKYSSYPIEKNVREMLSKTIKNQGERIYANHSSVVGLGIGSMDCKGQIKPCIIIYCLDKDLVPFGEKPLPKTLEGFSCDIREDFIMFGACFDCHEIAHPNPGCCIGLPSNGIGSAGFLAKTHESGLETSGFLTAAHVAAENWTDLYNKKALLSEFEGGQYNFEIVHCPLLPNDNSGQIIGKVRESYCGNWGQEDIGIDAAFVQNYEQDRAACRELQPADESELDYGDQLIVLKRGGTTGKTFGRLLDGSHSPCVNPRLDDIAWRLGGFYFFDRCFAVEDISGPFFNLGDSGSGVFLTENENPTKPLGIAFAKLDIEPITFVCRVDQVVKAFNLRLYEIVEAMET